MLGSSRHIVHIDHFVEFTMVTMSPSLLLCTVSDEDTQARTDRVMLTPWVKFLWESYRNILELTKNNQTFEKLYTEVAKEGICVIYVTMMMFMI